MAAKKELLASVQSMKTQNKVIVELERLVSTILSSSGYKIDQTNIDTDRLEFVIEKETLLIWFYPNRWVFPHSSEVWQLIQKSEETGLRPVILARTLYGLCFPLFKILGLFGGNIYSLYLPEAIVAAIDEFNAKSWELPIKIKFSPGNICATNADVNIEHFFSSILRISIFE